MRRILSSWLMAGLLCLASSTTWAQTYPSSPITLIVPFGAGQSSDTVARVLSQSMTHILGEPVIVQNKPGAGGALGLIQVARSKADGYTLGMGTIGPLSQQPYLGMHLALTPQKDLAPISNVAITPVVLLVKNDSPIKTVQDLIALAKSKPGQVNFASAGIGSNQHVAMALFEARTHTSMNHIPYKGSDESYTALLGGTVTAMFDAVPAALAQVRAGTVRALAIADTHRSPFLPDVPTLDSLGIKNAVDVGWMGIVAPAGTPAAVLDRLNAAVQQALKDPDTDRKLRSLGFLPAPTSREAFTRFIDSENQKWSGVIHKAGIKVD